MQTRLPALLALTALALALNLQNVAAAVLPIQPDSVWLRADQGVRIVTPPIVERMTNQSGWLVEYTGCRVQQPAIQRHRDRRQTFDQPHQQSARHRPHHVLSRHQ